MSLEARRSHCAADRCGLLSALRAAVPLNPIGVSEDPYATWAGRAPRVPPPSTVCAVRLEADRKHYRLATFGSAAEAGERGYRITHTGACGACSTLQDLAVYLERPDLTTPVRQCGMQSGTLRCLEALGFTHGCAQIWNFNVQNTRRECFGICMRSWISGEASTKPDGMLNDCLQCDEDRSGAVFKAVAGRTRRNSAFAPPSNARTSRYRTWCTTTSPDRRRDAAQGCRTRVVSRYFGPWRGPAVPANEQG